MWIFREGGGGRAAIVRYNGEKPGIQKMERTMGPLI